MRTAETCTLPPATTTAEVYPTFNHHHFSPKANGKPPDRSAPPSPNSLRDEEALVGLDQTKNVVESLRDLPKPSADSNDVEPEAGRCEMERKVEPLSLADMLAAITTSDNAKTVEKPGAVIEPYTDQQPLTEAEVLDALIREAEGSYGHLKRKSVDKICIIAIQNYTAWHYQLETYTESRTTSEVTEPCKDKSSSAAADCFVLADALKNRWDFDQEPSALFCEETRHYTLPDTLAITTCHSCGGQGSSYCFACHGTGKDVCRICNGTGMKTGVPHPTQALLHGSSSPYHSVPPLMGVSGRNSISALYGGGNTLRQAPYGGTRYSLGGIGRMQSYPAAVQSHSFTGSKDRGGILPDRFPLPGILPTDLCIFCRGIGGKSCFQCKGQGHKMCQVCSAVGQLRSFQRLTIKYHVERDEVVIGSSIDLPEYLLKKAEGDTIFFEQDELVRPITTHFDADVNLQSKKLITHRLKEAIGAVKILQQRHCLRALPFSVVLFRYKNYAQLRRFAVYGKDRRVHIEKLPKKCCIL